MLVVLNSREHAGDLESLGREVAGNFVGRTNIYLPRGLGDYVDKIKSHKNNAKGKNHLLLLASHYGVMKNEPEGAWRSAELFLQRYGGSVWGDKPSRDSITYSGGLEDIDRLVKQAQYNEGRLSVFKKLPSSYLGRTESDPHTLIVGFKPPFPKTTKYSEYLLSALPDDWWQGVAFMPASHSTAKNIMSMIDWMDQTNIVSIGDTAHEILTDLEIEHGAMPSVNDVYRREDLKTAKKVGRTIREATRTFEDLRTWRP